MATAAPQGGSSPTICKVVLSLDSEDDDLLALEIGDKVQVIFEDDSGWWVGQNLRTNAIGIFPVAVTDIGNLDGSMTSQSRRTTPNTSGRSTPISPSAVGPDKKKTPLPVHVMQGERSTPSPSVAGVGLSKMLLSSSTPSSESPAFHPARQTIPSPPVDIESPRPRSASSAFPTKPPKIASPEPESVIVTVVPRTPPVSPPSASTPSSLAGSVSAAASSASALSFSSSFIIPSSSPSLLPSTPSVNVSSASPSLASSPPSAFTSLAPNAANILRVSPSSSRAPSPGAPISAPIPQNVPIIEGKNSPLPQAAAAVSSPSFPSPLLLPLSSASKAPPFPSSLPPSSPLMQHASPRPMSAKMHPTAQLTKSNANDPSVVVQLPDVVSFSLSSQAVPDDISKLINSNDDILDSDILPLRPSSNSKPGSRTSSRAASALSTPPLGPVAAAPVASKNVSTIQLLAARRNLLNKINTPAAASASAITPPIRSESPLREPSPISATSVLPPIPKENSSAPSPVSASASPLLVSAIPFEDVAPREEIAFTAQDQQHQHSQARGQRGSRDSSSMYSDRDGRDEVMMRQRIAEQRMEDEILPAEQQKQQHSVEPAIIQPQLSASVPAPVTAGTQLPEPKLPEIIHEPFSTSSLHQNIINASAAAAPVASAASSISSTPLPLSVEPTLIVAQEQASALSSAAAASSVASLKPGVASSSPVIQRDFQVGPSPVAEIAHNGVIPSFEETLSVSASQSTLRAVSSSSQAAPMAIHDLSNFVVIAATAAASSAGASLQAEAAVSPLHQEVKAINASSLSESPSVAQQGLVAAASVVNAAGETPIAHQPKISQSVDENVKGIDPEASVGVLLAVSSVAPPQSRAHAATPSSPSVELASALPAVSVDSQALPVITVPEDSVSITALADVSSVLMSVKAEVSSLLPQEAKAPVVGHLSAQGLPVALSAVVAPPVDAVSSVPKQTEISEPVPSAALQPLTELVKPQEQKAADSIVSFAASSVEALQSTPVEAIQASLSAAIQQESLAVQQSQAMSSAAPSPDVFFSPSSPVSSVGTPTLPEAFVAASPVVLSSSSEAMPVVGNSAPSSQLHSIPNLQTIISESSQAEDGLQESSVFLVRRSVSVVETEATLALPSDQSSLLPSASPAVVELSVLASAGVPSSNSVTTPLAAVLSGHSSQASMDPEPSSFLVSAPSIAAATPIQAFAAASSSILEQQSQEHQEPITSISSSSSVLHSAVAHAAILDIQKSSIAIPSSIVATPAVESNLLPAVAATAVVGASAVASLSAFPMIATIAAASSGIPEQSEIRSEQHQEAIIASSSSAVSSVAAHASISDAQKPQISVPSSIAVASIQGSLLPALAAAAVSVAAVVPLAAAPSASSSGNDVPGLEFQSSLSVVNQNSAASPAVDVASLPPQPATLVMAVKSDGVAVVAAPYADSPSVQASALLVTLVAKYSIPQLQQILAHLSEHHRLRSSSGQQVSNKSVSPLSFESDVELHPLSTLSPKMEAVLINLLEAVVSVTQAESEIIEDNQMEIPVDHTVEAADVSKVGPMPEEAKKEVEAISPLPAAHVEAPHSVETPLPLSPQSPPPRLKKPSSSPATSPLAIVSRKKLTDIYSEALAVIDESEKQQHKSVAQQQKAAVPVIIDQQSQAPSILPSSEDIEKQHRQEEAVEAQQQADADCKKSVRFSQASSSSKKIQIQEEPINNEPSAAPSFARSTAGKSMILPIPVLPMPSKAASSQSNGRSVPRSVEEILGPQYAATSAPPKAFQSSIHRAGTLKKNQLDDAVLELGMRIRDMYYEQKESKPLVPPPSAPPSTPLPSRSSRADAQEDEDDDQPMEVASAPVNHSILQALNNRFSQPSSEKDMAIAESQKQSSAPTVQAVGAQEANQQAPDKEASHHPAKKVAEPPEQKPAETLEASSPVSASNQPVLAAVAVSAPLVSSGPAAVAIPAAGSKPIANSPSDAPAKSSAASPSALPPFATSVCSQLPEAISSSPVASSHIATSAVLPSVIPQVVPLSHDQPVAVASSAPLVVLASALPPVVADTIPDTKPVADVSSEAALEPIVAASILSPSVTLAAAAAIPSPPSDAFVKPSIASPPIAALPASAAPSSIDAPIALNVGPMSVESSAASPSVVPAALASSSTGASSAVVSHAAASPAQAPSVASHVVVPPYAVASSATLVAPVAAAPSEKHVQASDEEPAASVTSSSMNSIDSVEPEDSDSLIAFQSSQQSGPKSSSRIVSEKQAQKYAQKHDVNDDIVVDEQLDASMHTEDVDQIYEAFSFGTSGTMSVYRTAWLGAHAVFDAILRFRSLPDAERQVVVARAEVKQKQRMKKAKGFFSKGNKAAEDADFIDHSDDLETFIAETSKDPLVAPPTASYCQPLDPLLFGDPTDLFLSLYPDDDAIDVMIANDESQPADDAVDLIGEGNSDVNNAVPTPLEQHQQQLHAVDAEQDHLPSSNGSMVVVPDAEIEHESPISHECEHPLDGILPNDAATTPAPPSVDEEAPIGITPEALDVLVPPQFIESHSTPLHAEEQKIQPKEDAEQQEQQQDIVVMLGADEETRIGSLEEPVVSIAVAKTPSSSRPSSASLLNSLSSSILAASSSRPSSAQSLPSSSRPSSASSSHRLSRTEKIRKAQQIQQQQQQQPQISEKAADSIADSVPSPVLAPALLEVVSAPTKSHFSAPTIIAAIPPFSSPKVHHINEDADADVQQPMPSLHPLAPASPSPILSRQMSQSVSPTILSPRQFRRKTSFAAGSDSEHSDIENNDNSDADEGDQDFPSFKGTKNKRPSSTSAVDDHRRRRVLTLSSSELLMYPKPPLTPRSSGRNTAAAAAASAVDKVDKSTSSAVPVLPRISNAWSEESPAQRVEELAAPAPAIAVSSAPLSKLAPPSKPASKSSTAASSAAVAALPVVSPVPLAQLFSSISSSISEDERIPSPIRSPRTAATFAPAIPTSKPLSGKLNVQFTRLLGSVTKQQPQQDAQKKKNQEMEVDTFAEEDDDDLAAYERFTAARKQPGANQAPAKRQQKKPSSSGTGRYDLVIDSVDLLPSASSSSSHQQNSHNRYLNLVPAAVARRREKESLRKNINALSSDSKSLNSLLRSIESTKAVFASVSQSSKQPQFHSAKQQQQPPSPRKIASSIVSAPSVEQFRSSNISKLLASNNSSRGRPVTGSSNISPPSLSISPSLSRPNSISPARPIPVSPSSRASNSSNTPAPEDEDEMILRQSQSEVEMGSGGGVGGYQRGMTLPMAPPQVDQYFEDGRVSVVSERSYAMMMAGQYDYSVGSTAEDDSQYDEEDEEEDDVDQDDDEQQEEDQGQEERQEGESVPQHQQQQQRKRARFAEAHNEEEDVSPSPLSSTSGSATPVSILRETRSQSASGHQHQQQQPSQRSSSSASAFAAKSVPNISTKGYNDSARFSSDDESPLSRSQSLISPRFVPHPPAPASEPRPPTSSRTVVSAPRQHHMVSAASAAAASPASGARQVQRQNYLDPSYPTASAVPSSSPRASLPRYPLTSASQAVSEQDQQQSHLLPSLSRASSLPPSRPATTATHPQQQQPKTPRTPRDFLVSSSRIALASASSLSPSVAGSVPPFLPSPMPIMAGGPGMSSERVLAFVNKIKGLPSPASLLSDPRITGSVGAGRGLSDVLVDLCSTPPVHHHARDQSPKRSSIAQEAEFDPKFYKFLMETAKDVLDMPASERKQKRVQELEKGWSDGASTPTSSRSKSSLYNPIFDPYCSTVVDRAASLVGNDADGSAQNNILTREELMILQIRQARAEAQKAKRELYS